MLKKMCPVCDIPLKAGNYCPVCRKVIRHPVTWEVNYYLNESYPKNEDVCGYHKSQPEADRHEGKAVKGTYAAPVRTVNPPKTTGQPAKKTSEENKKPWNAFAGAGIAIVCVLLSAGINIAKLGIQGISSYYENSQSVEEEVDYEDEGYHELDEAEVIGEGKPCDGYFHFPASSPMIESMGGFLKNSDFGYTVSSEDLYTYNYETLGDNGKSSYFEKIYSFTMEDENTKELDFSDEDYLYQYVDINYDTVTGQIHEYNSCFYNEEASYLCLEEFLRQMEAEAGVSKEDSRFEEVLLQVKDYRSYIIEGIFEVNIYRSEGQVEIYVSYNDPSAAANQEA